MGTVWEYQGLRLWQSDDMRSYSISDKGATSQVLILIEECSSRIPFAKEHVEQRATFVAMYNRINPALLIQDGLPLSEVPQNVIYGERNE